MVISFRLSGRRRRYHPPPPPPACAYAAATPHATTTSLEGPPPPPPRPPWEAAGSWIDSGSAAPLDLHERSDVDSVEPDLEPSFALNLFLDGYSIGEPDKGMLAYLIGDDPKKRPYSRASNALFSDIEYGCLPLEVLHDIPCKFRNGSTVCEVRDYRLLSTGGDYSGDDFPKVNRISLRIGTGCVVKDLSSIVDASWTYHEQLIAESVVLNALQPTLNLNPTACLQKLCSCKKIDLGLEKGRQQAEEKSLYISANTPGSCKPEEFNVCRSGTLCIEDEALEGRQSGMFNSASVNCASMILVNNAESPAEPDPNNTILSYTLKNNSALSDDRQESASSIASENLVQGNELQAQVVTLQVDSKIGQPQNGIVPSSKRKKCSNVVEERHESKKRSCSNKVSILNSQHFNVTEKSAGTSHNERLDLGSPKVMGDQVIDAKDMKVKPQPEDLRERGTSFVSSFRGNSRVTSFKPHHLYKAGTEPKHIASKGNILGISTISLKQELKFKKTRQKIVDTQHKSPFENISAEKPDVIDGIGSQLGLVPDNRRQRTKDAPVLHKTADALQNCKLVEFTAHEGAAICIQNATLEGRPCVKFNSSSVNYASSILDNDANLSVQSDPDSTVQSSKLTDISAKYDKKQRTLRTHPNHLFQSIEQKAQMSVQPCKGNKSSKVLHEKHKSKTHIPPRKTERLVSESCIGPAVVVDDSGMTDLRGSTTPSVKSFNAGSRKASFKRHEDKSEAEPQCDASNSKVSVSSTVSSNADINSEGKTQGTINMWVKSICEDRSPEPPCLNRSLEETHVNSGADRKLNTSPNQSSCTCTEHCLHTTEPEIEKILSEVILTTQRHRQNGTAARNDDLGTTYSLVQSECFQPENIEKYQSNREEAISYHATSRITSTCKIRSIAFHPSQYFSCKGIVDDSHYTLCLLESQAPGDHQIIVGATYGDEHTHIATLPTYCHAEKFVDQFICLMKRDGYNLCEDKVLTEPSELRQQFKDVSQLCYDTGECAQHLMPSPSVVNSSAMKEDNNVYCTFQNRVPDYVNLLQQDIHHWVMTQQSRSLGIPESLFLKSNRSSGLQHNNRILQHMGPSFPFNVFAMNLHQVPSVQLSKQVSMDEYGQYMQCRHDTDKLFAMEFPSVQLSEVSIDEYWQRRHYVPGFSNMYGVGTSGSSYGQWRSVPTQLGNVVYQWDLPASVREINNSPVPDDGRMISWSELQPIRSPPMISRSTAVELPIPLNSW